MKPAGFIGAGLLLSVLATVANAASTPALPESARADKVLVEKHAHLLTLISHGHILKTYSVSLGHGGLQPKTREGDGLTPEGAYKIDGRLKNSAFHLALHISYPSAQQRAAAANQNINPGGAIMIHGLRNHLGWVGGLHRMIDWTDGCIAVTDPEIEEIWTAVPNGTPVEIRP